MDLRFVVLASYFEQQADCSRYRRNIRQSRGSPLVLVEESIIFTFLCQENGNHATESSTVGHVTSERHWKSTFDFIEIVNYEWKEGKACQIVRFISQFSLKLYIQFWKYFHSVVLSKYLFGNEKKIYNEITEIRYINFVNWVSLKD